MSSTFGSFNTVRLGIYAAQKGLDVTGNNITNINTAGYTRQRLDQVSLITSASDRYYSPYKDVYKRQDIFRSRRLVRMLLTVSTWSLS